MIAHLTGVEIQATHSTASLSIESSKRVDREAAARKMIAYLTGAESQATQSTAMLNASSVSNGSSQAISPDGSFSSTSTSTNGESYINELLELCTKFLLETSFELTAMSGEPHRPSFTYTCQVKDRKCDGTAASKKCAKNLAAKAMLDVVYNDLLPNDDSMIPSMELPDVEEILAAYAKCKSSEGNVRPKKRGVRAMCNPFRGVSDEQLRRAASILTGRHLFTTKPSDMIEATCKALKMEYEIKTVRGHANMRQFLLKDSPYDCVLIEEVDILHERVLAYFRIMLNVDKCTLP